jgi:hypothetical protein
LDYFESLEFVDGVTLQEITGDALALSLQSLAGLDQLRQLLVDDGRFQSPEAEAEAEAGVDIGTGFSELVLPGRQQTKTVLQWRSDT